VRHLGLDVGTKTIGVAVSDELETVATSLEVIRRVGWKKDTARIREIIAKYGIGGIVVGLPRRTDGTLGPEAQAVQAFADKLQRQVNLPLYYYDERFTTKMAEQALLAFDVSRKKRREVIDGVAAAVILQSWLDSRRNPGKG
jgi:putative Holliday junction resolvase